MRSVKVQGTASRLRSVVFYPIKERTFGHVVFAKSTVAGAVHLDAIVEFLTPLLEEEGPNGVSFQKFRKVLTFILQFGGDSFATMFPRKQINRGDLITWPPRLPDLTPGTRRCLRSATARITRDSAATLELGLQTYGTRDQDRRR
jgi:hypothetical protein